MTFYYILLCIKWKYLVNAIILNWLLHIWSLLGTVCILGCRGTRFAGVQALCVEPLRRREECHCPQPQLWHARELQWFDLFSKPVCSVRSGVRLASPFSRLLCRGGEEKRGWCTLLAHALSSLGSLHATPLHKNMVTPHWRLILPVRHCKCGFEVKQHCCFVGDSLHCFVRGDQYTSKGRLHQSCAATFS